jgi:hypothetical protein
LVENFVMNEIEKDWKYFEDLNFDTLNETVFIEKLEFIQKKGFERPLEIFLKSKNYFLNPRDYQRKFIKKRN